LSSLTCEAVFVGVKYWQAAGHVLCMSVAQSCL